jgi:hypothetical protein
MRGTRRRVQGHAALIDRRRAGLRLC